MAWVTGGGVGSPPTGLSPAGGAGVTGGAPLIPGVMPVLAGACAAGVVDAAVGSWWAVAELTAVVMLSAAAVGMFGSPIDGMRGMPVGLICWCCSLD
ncbi:hypothetical protein [Mycobacteroides abscessus]|uniref:hypothetical protein n=1 Tax=Mycobacteroides abscessus TaxID=36809 RepID=UPI001F179078|nr:hypothetical protein [Mycobacteroides abscessus]